MKNEKNHQMGHENSLSDYIEILTDRDLFKENDDSFYRTMFENLINSAPVGIYVFENNAFAFVNKYYANLIGYSQQELTSGVVTLEDVTHPEDCSLLKTFYAKKMAGEDIPSRYRVRKFRKDGSSVYTEVYPTEAIMFGKLTFFGMVIDISEQVKAEKLLKESNERFESLFHNSPDAIFTLNDEGEFMSANQASEEITGYTKNELLNMHFSPLICSEDLAMAIEYFEKAKKGIASSYDLGITRKDGQVVYVHITHFPMTVDEKTVGTYGIAKDITQKILYDQQKEQMSFYDPLTNLPNRKLFEDRLGQMLNIKTESQNQLAVLFLDLDRFKFINDSLGHHIGDDFLRLVAERLKQSLRKQDTISRLAGDEFLFLLPDVTEEMAITIVQNIQRTIKEPFYISGQNIIVSASIGIAFSDRKESNPSELIRNADTAMNYSRKFRRGSYTVYSEELDLKASYRLTIERDLKFAIENKEFELYYQPIVDLKTKKCKAVEALIRWHHPKLGLIPPSDFIAVAEESEQIISIGYWVLETACRQAKEWKNNGISPLKVAVNISTKQLQQPNFVDQVTGILNKIDLDSSSLELEVTESMLLDDIGFIKESLLKLKKVGVSISIDDFGTGYTSLSYLRQYPFDKVKIDRSFISDISGDLNGKRITSAIISLAHTLNMGVVAEGIENDVQLNFLKEEACDEGQGYLFSRPLPANSININI